MQQRIETIILKNLIHNEEYSRKVIPFLNKEYFMEHTDKILYTEINKFIEKYNNLPTKEALVIELDSSTLKEEEFSNVTELLTYIEGQEDEKSDLVWLLETTEKFCQDKAIYNAVVSSIKILDEPENLTLTRVLFLSFLPMLFLLALILMLGMIIFWTLMIVMISITRLKKRFHLTLITSTR